MIESSVCLENLKTCFESKELNQKDFSISAVQKACLISFFEARDTIAFGLDKGILFSRENTGDALPVKALYFSGAPDGCVVDSTGISGMTFSNVIDMFPRADSQ